MDNFMDKITQKLNSQDMIRANAAADAAELENLENQVTVFKEQIEKYEVDYGEAGVLDENANVVRIMSIHKSKGLEFPICFLAGMAKQFNMQDMITTLRILLPGFQFLIN